MRGEEGAEVRGRTGLKDGHEEGKNGWAKEWDELCSGKWPQLIRHETRPGVAKEGGERVGGARRGRGTRRHHSSLPSTSPAGLSLGSRIGPQSIRRL